MGVRVFVIHRPINRNEVGFPLEPKHTGAIVEYFHVVRAQESGENVRALRFNTDREVLRSRLHEIGTRLTQDYDLTDFECFRRIGEVPAGEPCLLVRIGALHAHDAFRATNDFLEQIKTVEVNSELVKA